MTSEANDDECTNDCNTDVPVDKDEDKLVTKSELKIMLEEKIRYKLELDWFREWYTLLTSASSCTPGDKGKSECLFSAVCNYLSKKDRDCLSELQKGYENILERLQYSDVICEQIRGVRETYTNDRETTQKDDQHRSIQDVINDLCTIKNQFEDLKKEISRLRETSRLEHDLQVTKDELRKVSKEKEDALTRLSQIAGNKLQQNNSDITDLSDRNRPTNLAEKLNEVYDNEWTDAFDHLTQTQSKSQETAIADLLSLLKFVYTECNLCAAAQKNNLSNALQLSVSATESTERDSQESPQDLVQYHVQKQIVYLQKSTAEYTIARMKKRLKSTLKLPDGKLTAECEHCSPYIDKCIELCWYMNIQERPVVLLFNFVKGEKFGVDLYRHYTKSGNKCDFLVWPAMLLHKDGPLLQKGVMQPE